METLVVVQSVVEVAMGDEVNLVEGDLGVVGVIVEEEMVSVVGMVAVTDMLMHIATVVTDTMPQMLVGMERRRGVVTEAEAIAGVLVVHGHIVAVAAVVMIVIVMCGRENIADPHL
jgi:hypothetical protein